MFDVSLASFDGGVATDVLGSSRSYRIAASDPLRTVTAADPDFFTELSRSGDIVFDNDDFGLVQGTIRLFGPNPTLDIDLLLTLQGNTDFSNTATFEFVGLPTGATFSSESGVFLTTVVPLPSGCLRPRCW
ncbi:MAG: hypothetical protein HKN56_06080 [Gammaproteobacteria bacterium]|nr:hypothetical protein [Gammaproteobacteria bacterium]